MGGGGGSGEGGGSEGVVAGKCDGDSGWEGGGVGDSRVEVTRGDSVATVGVASGCGWRRGGRRLSDWGRRCRGGDAS